MGIAGDQMSDTRRYWEVESYQDFCDFAGEELESDPPKDEPPKDGVLTLRLKNWRLLDPLLYTLVKMSHAIFRGIDDSDLPLEPSIFRGHVFKNLKQTIHEKNDYIKTSYDHFVEAVRGRRGPLSKPLDTYNQIEIWSLGRHFGVNNTLLDWSHSPYIALFFAFACRKKGSVRSLYCLKKNVIEDAQKLARASRPRNRSGTNKEEDSILLTENAEIDSLVFYKPMSDENYRMINQQGLFTVSKSPHSIDDWVSRNYKEIQSHVEKALGGETREETKEQLELKSENWVLLKVDIETDSADRGQILRMLNRMNINHASLFPDVEGASLYANMQGSVRHY